MTISFNILNRFTGSVQVTAQIECKETNNNSIKLGLAVKWAIEKRADLRSADLHGANLRSADLRSADLHGANLRSADLRSADLHGADLYGADLRSADLHGANLRSADLRSANLHGANLYGANLRSADLRSADLYGANLRGADLYGANLRSADLRSADLYGANLRSADLHGADLYGADLRSADLHGADLHGADLHGADLRSYKACLWLTLAENRNEVAGVAEALKNGKVNGSTYSGNCACLIGTVANVRGVDVDTLDKNPSNPSEQWFTMIGEGDLPTHDTAGGFAAKIALEWVEEWLALNGQGN